MDIYFCLHSIHSSKGTTRIFLWEPKCPYCTCHWHLSINPDRSGWESEVQFVAGTSPVAYFSAVCSAYKAASLKLLLGALIYNFIFCIFLVSLALTLVHLEPVMKSIEDGTRKTRESHYTQAPMWTCTLTLGHAHEHLPLHQVAELKWWLTA